VHPSATWLVLLFEEEVERSSWHRACFGVSLAWEKKWLTPRLHHFSVIVVPLRPQAMHHGCHLFLGGPRLEVADGSFPPTHTNFLIERVVLNKQIGYWVL
jgi:hypothetical protein